jgi:glycosyltransferase 2 family protein
VLAGLLLFRLLYYIIPFALALAILGSREIWLNLSGARRSPGPAVIPSLAEPIRSEIESEKTDAN